MEKEIVIAIITLTGTVIGALIPATFNLLAAKLETKKEKIASVLCQYASFYELEKLYLEEIERLRKGEPASGNGKTAEGIKREFRGRNEENGNVHIEMTSRSVTEFANKI